MKHPFDLERAIKAWLRSFRRHKAFDTGGIQEMELHLRDHIDDLVKDGVSEEEAFRLAVSEFGEIPPVAREEFWNHQRNNSRSIILNSAMFNNYLKTALRNFWRNKFYTLVNVFGLTLGLTTVILIGLFVTDELSFDRFHAKRDELYRVVENQYYAGQPVFPVAVTPSALGGSLKEEYPEIVNFTRLSRTSNQFELGDLRFQEGDGAWVDEGFFDMFSFPIVEGTVENWQEQLNGLVINQEMAEKYFLEEDPIGKLLKLNGEDFTVVAVMENTPKNSHLNLRFVKNIAKYFNQNPNRDNDWGSNWLYTYVELVPGADLETVNEKVIGQIKANNEGSVTDIYLQPLTDIYLGDVDFVVEVPRKGEMVYVQIFSIVAVFILLISCINFMNLSTARSAKRAKEVGLRKTIGARREQLVVQFLSESVALTVFSVLLSVLLVALVLPSFNQLANKEFELSAMLSGGAGIRLILGVLIAAIVTGLLAGSYPAAFLSSAKPISTLNAQVVSLKGGAGLRRILVVVQFVISIILIIGTGVIYSQLTYIQNVDLGYNRQNIIYTSVRGSQSATFSNALRGKAAVVDVGVSNQHPAYVMSSTSGFGWPGKNPEENILMHYMGVDENYTRAMEITILEGREFQPSDSSVIMINEKAKEMMGLEDPVGKIVTRGTLELRIAAVVKDFNFKSVHTEIEPMIIAKLDNLSQVYVRYQTGQEEAIVSSMESTWNEMFPDSEFSYYFLEQDFEELYQAEVRTKTLSSYFAVLAIVISCLGLFGLVSYAMEQRTREIGIRKALGAPVHSLFLLLTRDFTRLVIISLVLAIPVGWYAMGQWLDGFAYRIALSPWTFVLAAAAALAITFLTISYQSMRASRRSPVKALRDQ